MLPLAAAGSMLVPSALRLAPGLAAAMPGCALRAASGTLAAPPAAAAAAPPHAATAAPLSTQAAARAASSAGSSTSGSSGGGSGGGGWRRWLLGAGAAAAAAAGSAGIALAKADASAAAAKQQQHAGAAGGKAKQLPQYTEEEVAKHKTPESRIWVTYQGGVYDITDFVGSHPGGAHKIMLAAGGSIEPFWGLYQQHRKGEIREMLEGMRIGDLAGYVAGREAPLVDAYANEPKRHPALVVRSEKPFNAETPVELLADNLVTPADIFYVRHHLPVPAVDDAAFRLSVEGDGLRAVTLSVEELKARFKHASVTAALECAGNRRSQMKALPAPGGSGHAIKGLDWGAGAIGTAVWGGVKLRDVLLAAGLSPDDLAVAHIHFIGLDKDESGTPYMASIPLHKALDPRCDVLLAYEMNGQPLPRDHGGPLRLVVPGVAGARSVKWLDRVVAAREECQGFWQQQDYKAFSPGTDWDHIDWKSAPAIQDMNVTSAICSPTPGTEVSVHDGEVEVKGYAWSGGGRDIIRVDVSADGGATWAPASLTKPATNAPGRAWGMTLFSASLPLPRGVKGGEKFELVVKATDESYNTQPESPAAIWNVRGLINNAWHRVPVSVTAD